jgi:hypothetical protein
MVKLIFPLPAFDCVFFLSELLSKEKREKKKAIP